MINLSNYINTALQKLNNPPVPSGTIETLYPGTLIPPKNNNEFIIDRWQSGGGGVDKNPPIDNTGLKKTIFPSLPSNEYVIEKWQTGGGGVDTNPPVGNLNDVIYSNTSNNNHTNSLATMLQKNSGYLMIVFALLLVYFIRRR